MHIVRAVIYAASKVEFGRGHDWSRSLSTLHTETSSESLCCETLGSISVNDDDSGANFLYKHQDLGAFLPQNEVWETCCILAGYRSCTDEKHVPGELQLGILDISTPGACTRQNNQTCVLSC